MRTDRTLLVVALALVALAACLAPATVEGRTVLLRKMAAGTRQHQLRALVQSDDENGMGSDEESSEESSDSDEDSEESSSAAESSSAESSAASEESSDEDSEESSGSDSDSDSSDDDSAQESSDDDSSDSGISVSSSSGGSSSDVVSSDSDSDSDSAAGGASSDSSSSSSASPLWDSVKAEAELRSEQAAVAEKAVTKINTVTANAVSSLKSLLAGFHAQRKLAAMSRK